MPGQNCRHSRWLRPHPTPARTRRDLLVIIAVKPLEQAAQKVLALLQRIAQRGGHKLGHGDLWAGEAAAPRRVRRWQQPIWRTWQLAQQQIQWRPIASQKSLRGRADRGYVVPESPASPHTSSLLLTRPSPSTSAAATSWCSSSWAEDRWRGNRWRPCKRMTTPSVAAHGWPTLLSDLPTTRRPHTTLDSRLTSVTDLPCRCSPTRSSSAVKVPDLSVASGKEKGACGLQ